jgi:hypothetical protein
LGSISSDPSNTVSVPINITPAPTNLTYITACNKATLNWVAPGSCNYTYQVYQDSGSGFSIIGTTNNITTLGNITLVQNVTYQFYVIAVLGSIPSSPSSPLVSITFVEYAQTGGVEYNYNPLSGDTTSTGYTYILFDTVTVGTPCTFYSGCTITNFYYMIVGPGGNAQPGYTDIYYSIGGDGGGAGGIWNDVTILPQGNYNITIPNVDNTNSTIIEDSTTSTNFNITAATGSFTSRGAVTKTVNSAITTLSPTSTTNSPPIADSGVGGKPSEVTNASGSYVATPGSIGGSVYLGTSSSGNYIYFVGDGKLSTKLFGGGGGGGGTGGGDIYPATTGYNGGGGGGGGGEGLNGGTGTNGSNGTNGGTTGGTGGSAFTSSQGYGGGGGGGGSIFVPTSGGGAIPRGLGGTGGPAMLMIYFIKQF